MRTRLKLTTGSLLTITAATVLTLLGQGAHAATYFVALTNAAPEITTQTARATTDLVKNAVSNRAGDMIVEDEYRADFTLQPKLMKLGEDFILTVEKRRGTQIQFVAQSKAFSVEQLDRAAQSATDAAIEQSRMAPREAVAGNHLAQPQSPQSPQSQMPGQSAPYQAYSAPPPPPLAAAGTASGAINPAPAPAAPIANESRVGQPAMPDYANSRSDHWTIGVGPFIPRRMGTTKVMYDVSAGHIWDVNPLVSVKAIGEVSLSSGGDNASFFNAGVGANYYLPGSIEAAPYVTADMGYGLARDAGGNTGEGFSVGTGVGYQFFRNTETTMDLLVRYNAILSGIQNGDGSPSVFGVRLAVNF
jgi:hypothetical protein